MQILRQSVRTGERGQLPCCVLSTVSVIELSIRGVPLMNVDMSLLP